MEAWPPSAVAQWIVRTEDGALVEVGHDDAALDAGDHLVRQPEPEGVDLRLVGGVFEGLVEAVDDEPAEAADLGVGQGLDDDLRPDAGRVAHGDADSGLGLASVRCRVGWCGSELIAECYAYPCSRSISMVMPRPD